MSDSGETDDAGTFEIPAEHLELLEDRRRRVETDESELLKWDEVKDSIGEARRRSKEFDEDPSIGLTWEELKRVLGR